MADDSIPRAPDVPHDRIEWRPQGSPYERGNGHVALFVPYLNSAIVADLLDQWVGPFNWTDDYTVGEVNRNEVMWCTITVHYVDDDGERRSITKTDLGKITNFEGEKGAVSDSFKRAACLKLGVGRNVYDIPQLWAPCSKDRKGNARPNDDTLPALRRQLVEMGYAEEAASRTATGEDGHEGSMPEGATPTRDEPAQQQATETRTRKQDGNSGKRKMKDPDGDPTNAQKTKLRLMLVEMGVIHLDEETGELDERIYRAAFQAAYDVDSLAKITKSQASTLIDQLENGNEEKDRSPEDVALALIKTGANYLDAQDEEVPAWAMQ